MAKLYIYLNKEYLDKTSKGANKRSLESGSYENDLLHDNLDFNIESIEVENGSMNICGNSDLGYISLDFNLDLDTAIDVIEFYMKKLGKLKTVLEATK